MQCPPEQDRAIEQLDDDRLDRGPFVESLVKALIKEERDETGKLLARRSRGFVIGLTGPWGSGKSSILNLLQARLSTMDRVVVAKLNPWLFKGEDEIFDAFFSSLFYAIGRSGLDAARDLIRSLDRYRAAIDAGTNVAAAAADAIAGVPSLTIAKAGWKKLGISKLFAPKEEPIEGKRKRLENLIRSTNAAVVVLIDELDRLEDDEVRSIARLVKAVGDIRGISYLVAYDPQRTAEALSRPNSRDDSSGERYLEKIIQHPIPLRPLFREDVDALLREMLKAHGVTLHEPKTDDERAISEHLVSAMATPRDVKRLVGAFAVFEAVVRGEINPYDVLAYSWIVVKSPSAASALADRPDAVVDDPQAVDAFSQAFGDAQKQPTPATALGPAAEPQTRTFQLLFPRFGERTRGDRGDRLALRRNLIRLLYLGNPPTMFTRARIEELWGSLDSHQLAATLEEIIQDGKLGSLLDRVGDLLPQLPPSGDKGFWPALSRAMMRPTDWSTGLPETNRNRTDDVVSLLLAFVRNERGRIPRIRSLMDTLIEANDLLIAPGLIRYHAFSYGLVEGENPRGGSVIFSEQETADYIQKELPRYVEAVTDGTFLKRVPDSEILYLIHNVGAWTSELRKALTNQLTHPAAIETFASLIVPPGVVIERTVLAQLIDADRTKALILEHFDLASPRSKDTWVRSAVRRLYDTLPKE